MVHEIEQVGKELARNGTLRVGLNLANFLLINPGTPIGVHEGIVPDLAQELARELNVALKFVPFSSPGPLGDAVDQDVWDLAFLADEPARAQTISFSPAYLEIQASYLVPDASPFAEVSDVDQPGVQIAAMEGGAYTLFLKRNLKHAKLVLAPTIDESFKVFAEQGLQALSGLRPRLLTDQTKLHGSRILPGCFTSVQQAVATSHKNAAAAAFLSDFVKRAQVSGMIQAAIDRHAVVGVNVAPVKR